MYWRVPYILNLGVVFFLETPYEPIALDMQTYIVLLSFIEIGHTAIQFIHT